jgi:hypothetical protein
MNLAAACIERPLLQQAHLMLRHGHAHNVNHAAYTGANRWQVPHYLSHK